MMQCKKLGLEIPNSFARPHSIRVAPKAIQEELLKFPETILEDPSYEDDKVVLMKYKDDPVKYILSSDLENRTHLQQGGEPTILL